MLSLSLCALSLRPLSALCPRPSPLRCLPPLPAPLLSALSRARAPQAQRVLELNPDHPVYATLNRLLTEDKDKLAQYTDLLYQQALLIEGMPIEDPVALSKMICDLMV